MCVRTPADVTNRHTFNSREKLSGRLPADPCTLTCSCSQAPHLTDVMNTDVHLKLSLSFSVLFLFDGLDAGECFSIRVPVWVQSNEGRPLSPTLSTDWPCDAAGCPRGRSAALPWQRVSVVWAWLERMASIIAV